MGIWRKKHFTLSWQKRKSPQLWVSEIARRYVYDRQLFEKMTENNRYATAEMIKRLFEANKRGYWDATEKELEKLKDAYLELKGVIEVG